MLGRFAVNTLFHICTTTSSSLLTGKNIFLNKLKTWLQNVNFQWSLLGRIFLFNKGSLYAGLKKLYKLFLKWTYISQSITVRMLIYSLLVMRIAAKFGRCFRNNLFWCINLWVTYRILISKVRPNFQIWISYCLNKLRKMPLCV